MPVPENAGGRGYGDKWANDAARTVNNAVAKISGYADRVKNDAGYWTQFEDVADYGAAMFDSGAETGDEFRQMVEAKNAKSAIANQALYQMLKGQPTTPAGLNAVAQAQVINQTQYAKAQAQKNSQTLYDNQTKAQNAAKTPNALDFREIDKKSVEKLKSTPPVSDVGKHHTQTYYFPEAAKALGLDAVAFIKDVSALQKDNDRLKDIRSNMPVNINNNVQMDAYKKINAQIEATDKQIKSIVENNADAYVKLTMNRMLELAKKETLTPDERNEVILYIAALRKSADNLSGFGKTYDKDKKILSNSYEALAGILASKSNELRAYATGAATSIPGYADGVAMLNSPGMQAVNNGAMIPAVSSIANKHNPITDVYNNNPIYFNAGLVSGIAAQTALGAGVTKALSAADETFLADEIANSVDDFYRTMHLEDTVSGGYNGDAGNKFDSLDDFLKNPEIFGNATPNEWYQYFKDKGYNPQPMSKGGLGGVPLDQGGGFKVNWGGDRIWEYHPSGLNHHGGDAYYKISSGPTGKMWFDMNGNPLLK